jgi:hypothetical protein
MNRINHSADEEGGNKRWRKILCVATPLYFNLSTVGCLSWAYLQAPDEHSESITAASAICKP